MEKHFKRKSKLESSLPQEKDDNYSSAKQSRIEINLADLPVDPGLRPRIMDYNANDRDQIRRAYLQKVVGLSNAPQNLMLTSSDIQKDVVNVVAFETINVIIRDRGDALFAILIDEARDISMKEQMAVVIRYVDKKGQMIERFLGIKHVANTNALSLKQAVKNLFTKLGLSISRLRGQGYDGASNMQGEFNGLKTLLLKENLRAYYYHVNALDIIREEQAAKVTEAINTRELSSRQCLNQETILKRAGDTRWVSYYGTLVSLAGMFSTVIDVLEMISEDGSNSKQQTEANALLELIQSFELVFDLYLTKMILAITSELSQALQRKDPDIVNAMNLVQISKVWLQKMRESGWTSLLDDIFSFCEKRKIHVPQMDDMFIAQRRKRYNAQEISNLHHYRTELFYTVLDMQIQELNARFTESNTKLLHYVACLNPSNFFSSFDKKKLIHLTKFCPKEFSAGELMS
ncbi:zinc finger MYM-type protein 1-like [Camellia sinensis]|uniref:zinc finger MYM-type protein 1-like n=1 Tax=Camellia sinensis TaxID=4442 RepID=UPI001036CC80|nr:zinc finger MYM-type protein 1-like [Camellia sinensis]